MKKRTKKPRKLRNFYNNPYKCCGCGKITTLKKELIIMTKINELKDKIQKLISKADNWANRSKNLNRLLYQQLYEIIELERLEKLEGKFLQAYLLWKSIMRANYQTELLKIAPKDKEKLLETIEAEINSIEKRNQAEISQELTNEELLEQLRLRIKQGGLIIAKDGEIIEKSHAN